MEEWVRWLGSAHGIKTLEYFGGLLIGQEVLATSLGEERTRRMAERVQAFADRLRPANLDQVMVRLSRSAVGPFLAWTFYTLAGIAFLFALEETLRAGLTEPTTGLAGVLYRLRLWLTPEHPWPINDPHFLPLVAIDIVLVLGIPAALLAAGHAVRACYQPAVPEPEPSPPAETEAAPEVSRPTKITFGSPLPFSDLVGVFVLATLEVAVRTGRALGGGLFAITIGTLRRALEMIAAILEQGRLRRIGVIIGLAMLTVAYLLTLTGPLPSPTPGL